MRTVDVPTAIRHGIDSGLIVRALDLVGRMSRLPAAEQGRLRRDLE